MLKCFDSSGSVKASCLVLFIFVFHSFIFSQNFLLKGVVRDEHTLKPIQAVNIKIYGTIQGTSTDKSGSFSLSLKKIPVTLIITCLGYENAYFEATDRINKPAEIFLKPTSYPLQQVDVFSKKYSYLFNDKDYSILDYELMDSNLLLLVFRNQLKHSELVLLSRDGDTLCVSKLPEVPGSLFKDFLLKVHYFSKTDNSYQCYYNKNRNSIEFLFKTSVDSALDRLSPFIFRISDRLYFQEKVANGFGTAIGYYRMETGKKYIRKYFDEKRLSKYVRDKKINKRGSYFDPSRSYAPVSLPKLSRGSIGFSGAFRDGNFYTDPEFDFSYPLIDKSLGSQFDFYKMIYPVVKTRECNIAFINFSDDVIELMNENGSLLDTVPITFHKKSLSNVNSTNTAELSNAGWQWSWQILVDDYSADVYTIFKRNGMVKIERIDLETGKLHNGTVLPYAFPEKIKIYKEEAFFLIKRDGTSDNWKLMKCNL